MSKAFTSEENEDDFAIEAPALPAGAKNYTTPAGMARLRQEIDGLIQRQADLRRGDMADQAQAEKIERRLRMLDERLQAAEVIDPLQQPKDRVLFGATVDLEDAGGRRQSFRIVGFDETDLARGWISWMSPLAGALLEKRAGDPIAFHENRWTLRSIRYEP